MLDGPPVTIDVAWDGALPGGPAPAGKYRVTLVAEEIAQGWDIAVGPVATVPFPPVLDVAPSPWRIVLGNLHSQTGHSDGGGDLATCHGAQDPQSSPLGPGAAFAYADAHGLDFLVASEHNHLFDGSTGTNAAADPAAARGLFQSGLTLAAQYNQAHPAFLGIYAQEWGVIANGGHLNVFNAPSLLGWERNGAGALLADVETPKGDYAGLYTLMRKQGWIGQFNHPADSGQFVVDGVPLAYTPDGDAAMVLCEVVNTNAFSNSADESETRRSNYEAACNRALEAGYHLAFSTDQDNHCANWGMSYTNRTGGAARGECALEPGRLHGRAAGAPRVRHHGQGLATDPDGERAHDGRALRQHGQPGAAGAVQKQRGPAGGRGGAVRGRPGPQRHRDGAGARAFDQLRARARRAFLLCAGDPGRRQYAVVGARLGQPGRGGEGAKIRAVLGHLREICPNIDFFIIYATAIVPCHESVMDFLPDTVDDRCSSPSSFRHRQPPNEESMRRAVSTRLSTKLSTKLLPTFAILLALSAAAAPGLVIASETDHREFDATLHAPYLGKGAKDGRTFLLHFDYPHVATAQDVIWRLELVSNSGEVVQRWTGTGKFARASRSTCRCAGPAARTAA